jgi:hypothetical protein
MVRTRCLLALGLLVGACGGPNEPPAQPGRTSVHAARSSVVAALELRAALQTMNVDLIASGLLALHGSASLIVQPSDPPSAALVNGTTAVEHQSASSSCDASGCRFVNYPIPGSDSTLVGDIWIAPAAEDRKHLSWLLALQAPGGDGPGSLIFERWGDIVLSASHLSGEIRTTLQSQTGRETVGLETRIRYSDVVIADGAASAGTAYARYKDFATGGDISSVRVWDGTVNFAR